MLTILCRLVLDRGSLPQSILSVSIVIILISPLQGLYEGLACCLSACFPLWPGYYQLEYGLQPGIFTILLPARGALCMRAPSQAPPPPALPLTQASKPRLNDPFFPAEYTSLRRPPSKLCSHSAEFIVSLFVFYHSCIRISLSIINLLMVTGI